MLSQEIGEDWEPEVQEQWRTNQANVREHLIHTFGIEDYEQKIQNFVDIDAAPWSVAGLHTTYLQQVRAAFVSMNYYPALVGTCGLGERLLNQLVLTLRDDYADHPATKHVKNKKSFDDWSKCIKTLRAWGVVSTEVGRNYGELMSLRHGAVHYRPGLDSGEARADALKALHLFSGIVEAMFKPIGEQPHYFSGPIGRSYVRLDAESDPFVRRFILPSCVLVSPKYRFVASAGGPGGFDVYDDPAYGADEPPLTDDEFAEPERASPQVPYPF